MTSRRFWSLVLLVFFLSAAAGESKSEDDCVYTLYVRTGSVLKAGTDSKITVTLGDPNGKSVRIPDLEDWGLMGSKHDYFERGNLDIFTAKGPCLGSPLCYLNLTSDGSGSHHGWYCEYVEVTSTGPHKDCSQSLFYVQQWLATDAPPYQLTALLDGCAQETIKQPAHDRKGPFVVGNSKGSGVGVGAVSQ